MRTLEELLAAWRANPDADATVALCAQVGTSGREKLVQEVGERAKEQHRADARVMLALGRMYYDAGLLAESQTALVTAGKADPRDPAPFRWLGEVLLRRGDAARAQRVLERALELGQDDPATRLAHDRATVLMPLQERGGMKAVAAEVDRTLPQARFTPDWSDLEAPTVPREAPAVLEPDWSELEAPTVPREEAVVVQPAAPWLYRGPVPVTLPRVAPRVTDGSVDTDATYVMRSRRPASPGAMLEKLAAIGLYEPEPLTQLGWETPPAAGARGVWVLLLATVAAIATGGAAFVHADHVRAEREELGRELGEQVARLLDSGHAEDLEASDRLLTRVFELDSSSRGAASLWLKDRVLALLLRPEPPGGLESAILRARELGVPEEELAYGRIASKLAAGDLTDAVELLRRGDQAGKRDAMYQLVAAALLEKAGDPRAAARYEAALALDPHLWAAELLLASLVLLEQGPQAGRPLVLATVRHLGDQPATRALSALLWVVEGDPSRPLPANAEVGDDARLLLPRSLATVPFMVSALRSIGARELGHAREAIRKGLEAATSPGGAVRLGRLALQAGDEELAGRAALVALSGSPTHPGALGLAGRWALVTGRLEEAERAAHLLDPPERERLRALTAYEVADSAAFEGACEALAHASEHRGLCVGRRVLTGRPPLLPQELGEITALGRPWSELWAADVALDSGDLPKALALVSSWPPETRQRAPGLVREARLERYRGRSAEAVKLTQRAAELGSPTPRLVAERVFALVEAGQGQAALEYAERHATPLGAVGAWLVVFALARSDRLDDAQDHAARLTPPTEGSVLAHVVAARGLAAARDRRAPGYLTAELRGGRNQPDLLRAAAEYQAGINGS
jgi:tetratricopeptide (TPR) repeat protein